MVRESFTIEVMAQHNGNNSLAMLKYLEEAYLGEVLGKREI